LHYYVSILNFKSSYILNMSYSVITDPSGALLPDINNITYRNYNLDLSPTYDYTYQLRNSVGKVVANEFYPFSFPISTTLSSVTLYLTRDASNIIYGANYDIAPYYVKIVNSNLISANVPSYVRGASGAFDPSGVFYTPSFQPGLIVQLTRMFKTKFLENIITTTEFFVSNIVLRRIRGLDFDSFGNLYLADSNLSQIVKVTMVDYNNGIGSVFIPTYTGLTSPVDIKFDPYNNAYIANSGVNNIIRVTSDETISVFANGLQNMTEITYNIVDSTIYAACGNKIKKVINGIVSLVVDLSLNSYLSYGIVATTTGEVYYSATKVPFSLGNTNAEIFKIVPNNNFVITYNSPDPPITSVVFDNSGSILYSAQYRSNNPYVFPPPDPALGYIYANLTSFEPVENPISIDFDSSNNLYVASPTINSLFVINPSGTTKTLVTITGAPLSQPSSIAIDRFRKLYVANSANNTICILTFSNSSTATSVLLDISGATLLTPAGLAFDASCNNLYVSNAGDNNILKIDLLATPTPVASIYNLYGVSITSPSGLYFDNATGILYISGLDSSKIIQITNNNTASYVNIVPDASVDFSLPMGLTMDTSNNLYIANYGGSFPGVLKLNINITITPVITTGLLTNPSDTANAPTTKFIYISNQGNYNVNLFTSTDVLSVYATVAGYVLSLTINITSSRLYLLYDSGAVITINAGGTISNFTISGITPSAGSQCIRFRPRITPIDKDILYITDTSNNRIIKLPITTPSTGTGEVLNITNFPPNFKPTYIAFDSNNNMYMCAGSNLTSAYNSQSVYKINLNLPILIATLYITIPESSQLNGIDGIAFDSKNYMYSICKFNVGVKQLLFRTTPDGSITQLMHSFPEAPLFVSFTSINYIPWEDTLVMTGNNKLYKVYLSYPFTGILGQLGPYDDTLFIFDVTNAANNFDVSFNVYTPYIVIDPSNIPQDDPTNVTFHFLSPVVGPGLGPAIPAPSDSYILTCNGTKVSNVFCNNCTYNKSKFLAGTYPTGLVYSTDTTFLYVALQNNTISRVSVLGVVDNNYFPPNLGLVGPTSLVLDASFDMFVLNAGSDFISYITLRDNIISVNNSFFTGIYVPICLTYDADTDSLYLLSGAVPNTRITKINARTGVGQILPLAFGALYDPNGLTIDAYYGLFAPLNNQPPNIKYLYVSNQDQNKNNQIKRIDLTTTDSNGDLIYGITTLVSGLTYKPYTMANQNDGYLYVANKTSSNISKISLTGLAQNIQPWASSGISVPCDLCFDNFGNLYVANSGTSPRNSRVSKIYTDDFFFTDVILTDGTCSNAQIYDITTQSCVEVDYYPPPSNPCSFPIPIPYPIGSG
jgi:DNA-binding beta-propeller fold protein YncE